MLPSVIICRFRMFLSYQNPFLFSFMLKLTCLAVFIFFSKRLARFHVRCDDGGNIMAVFAYQGRDETGVFKPVTIQLSYKMRVNRPEGWGIFRIFFSLFCSFHRVPERYLIWLWLIFFSSLPDVQLFCSLANHLFISTKMWIYAKSKLLVGKEVPHSLRLII